MTLVQSEFKQNLAQEETYQALLRSLRRRKGFGIVFVQCSPATASRLIPRLKDELSQKTTAELNLTEPIDNLFELVAQKAETEKLNLLFIQGIDKSLEPYIEPGHGGDGDYYNLNTVPRILSHLNQQRENFRDHFSEICFVFILPKFAVKYFVRRAPDFFDWGTGVFIFLDEDSFSNTLILHKREEVDEEEYASNKDVEFNSEYQYWKHQSFVLNETGMYRDAIFACDKALELKLDSYDSWVDRGIALGQLGQLKAAITSFDKALQIKPDYDEAWGNRGVALHQSGQFEAAIASYEKALELNPDNEQVWGNRGLALGQLGQPEAAIASYEKALEINPDSYQVWINQGVALVQLGQSEAAIASFDKALELKPDDPNTFYNKAYCYALQAKFEAAIANLSDAIALSPNEYREMAKANSGFDAIRDNEQFQALISG
jgi:Tfp pilus assembly protein PilF